jgi:hypothetical protein
MVEVHKIAVKPTRHDNILLKNQQAKQELVPIQNKEMVVGHHLLH